MLNDDPTKTLTTDAAAPTPATPAPTSSGLKPMSVTNTAVPLTAAAKTAGAGGLATGLTTKAATAPAAPASTGPKINDSVAGKVNELISQDSPLMQQAKTDGLKAANRRGLLNSSMAVGAAQDATIRQALPIASQDASQAFQKNMQANDQGWRSGESALDRDQQTKLQDREIASSEGMAAAQRALQEKMQGADLDASRQAQIRDIASREGLAAAERQLQQWTTSINTSTQINLDREGRVTQQQMQDKEIAYQNANRNLDRDLQEKLASWNLKSADRNAAAQFLTNMEASYQDNYNSIMANTSLDAANRNAQLASAKALRDKNLSFVEQMYVIDLKW